MNWTTSHLRKWLARQMIPDVPLSTIPEEAAIALAALHDGGKVSLWVADGIPVVTSLVEPRRQSRNGSGLRFDSELPPGRQIRNLEDRSAGLPADIAIASEELSILHGRSQEAQGEVKRGRRSDYASLRARASLPRPTLFLLGVRAWDSLSRGGPFCPVCWGSKLRPGTYCLRCDRWGLDHLVPAIRVTEVKVVEPGTLASRRSRRKSKKST